MLTVGSLFAGVAGFDAGFEQAGFRTAWQVEIDPQCRQILEQHFPSAERFEDVTQCGSRNLKRVDVICGGFPCQDVSVAGKRAGLAGERTGLFFEAARILRELRPPWFVFENVPGLFSSNNGRDFAEVLRVLMVECGYGVCWRVLNSQFFGVAQRRRRVFLVGRFGAPCPASVLFEPTSGRRNSETGREAWEGIAAPLTSGSGVTGNAPGRRREDESRALGCPTSNGRNDPNGENFVVASTLRASDGHHGRSSPRGDGQDNIVATLNSGGNDGGFRTEPGEHIVIQSDAISRTGTAERDSRDAAGIYRKRDSGLGVTVGGPQYTLNASGEQHAVAYNIIGLGQEGRNHAYETDRTGAIQHKGNSASGNEAGTVVCATRTWTLRSEAGAPKHESDERQLVCQAPDANGMRGVAGFSEGLDLLPEGQDSRRYRQLGNAVTVSVAYWIAKRLKEEALK